MKEKKQNKQILKEKVDLKILKTDWGQSYSCILRGTFLHYEESYIYHPTANGKNKFIQKLKRRIKINNFSEYKNKFRPSSHLERTHYFEILKIKVKIIGSHNF